jgi:archaemetzincin
MRFLAGLLMIASCGKPPAQTAPPPPAAGRALGDPKPGEWRWIHDEPHQTFEDYVASCRNRRAPGRETFCLQPLGPAAGRYAETIGLLRDYAEAFFGIPARVCEPIPMFENGWIPRREQHNSTMLIGQLAERVPPDALVYVGITERDLFARGLRFVFGEGSLDNRCGIYSLRRHETEDRKLFLRRALRLMSHEVGHILSIPHCTRWHCVMQGANTLQESDGHPLELCPDDLRKLAWNTGVDPAARALRLETFCREAGLDPGLPPGVYIR